MCHCGHDTLGAPDIVMFTLFMHRFGLRVLLKIRDRALLKLNHLGPRLSRAGLGWVRGEIVER